MLRITGIVFAIALAAAVAPTPALAWSEQGAPVNTDGSSKFVDPDERLERLTGRTDERNGGTTIGNPSAGWSVSVVPQSSERSLFAPLYGPGWQDRRR